MEGDDKKIISAHQPLNDEELTHYKKYGSAQILTRDIDSFYGYLKKYNPKGKGQNRFCIILKGIFFYYKDSDSPKPNGVFKLEGYQAHSENNLCQSHMFKVEHKDTTGKNRSYSFSGASEKDQAKWVDYINKHVIKYYPASLYSENEKSDLYDYCPEIEISTLSRQYFLKKKASQENENEIIGHAYNARYPPNTNETPSEENERYATISSSSDYCNLRNDSNIQNQGPKPGPKPGPNNMTDDYTSMDGSNSINTSNGNMDDSDYMSMSNEKSGGSIPCEEGSNVVCKTSSLQNNIMTDDYTSMVSISENTSMNMAYDDPNYITVSNEVSKANMMDDEYTKMNDLQKEVKSIPLGRKMVRSASDAPPPSVKVLQKGNRSLTVDLHSETKSGQHPRTVNRTKTLSDIRPAIPPPIPERSPTKRGGRPTLENLHDDDIMPQSCINKNIQKDQCLEFLCPFEVGTYLIRTAREGKDALAVLSRKDPPRVKHFIVFERADGKRHLGPEYPTFETIQELIRYYYNNMLPQTELRLNNPLPSLSNRIKGEFLGYF